MSVNRSDHSDISHFDASKHSSRISESLLIPAPKTDREFDSQVLMPQHYKRLIAEYAARNPMQRFFKRAIDIVLSAFGLMLLSPLMALIALLIKLDSRGPVLFSQIRVGMGGQHFRIYKFRSLKHHASKQPAQTASPADGKTPEDPRGPKPSAAQITRVGRFIRTSSLDELPQLWNVLLGQMTLVGPRPALPSEVESWSSECFLRLAVPQGCTCIWQVSGRSQLSFPEQMALDQLYVVEWTLLQDLFLILQTVGVMISRKGAR
jgi:lipopolysaccharide/colanic/teichoic acid biosynthesis glycosyltransferase